MQKRIFPVHRESGAEARAVSRHGGTGARHGGASAWEWAVVTEVAERFGVRRFNFVITHILWPTRLASRSDCLMVAVGFIPRFGNGRRACVAERRLNAVGGFKRRSATPTR